METIPALELYSDEYDFDVCNTVVFICTFSAASNNIKSVISREIVDFQDTLRSLGYSEENIHRIDISCNNDLLHFMKRVKGENTISASIMLWLGEVGAKPATIFVHPKEGDVSVSNLWTRIYGVQNLLDKPKIHIIISYEGNIVTDAVPIQKHHLEMEEADNLIIYHCSKLRDSPSFLSTLCKNLKAGAQRDQLVHLACLGTHYLDENNENVRDNEDSPVIISTLCRKLYLQPSDRRGIDFDIDAALEKLEAKNEIKLRNEDSDSTQKSTTSMSTAKESASLKSPTTRPRLSVTRISNAEARPAWKY